jgi:hypothetical protein
MRVAFVKHSVDARRPTSPVSVVAKYRKESGSFKSPACQAPMTRRVMRSFRGDLSKSSSSFYVIVLRNRSRKKRAWVLNFACINYRTGISDQYGACSSCVAEGGESRRWDSNPRCEIPAYKAGAIDRYATSARSLYSHWKCESPSPWVGHRSLGLVL